jgi:adenylate cyclase class IV
MSQLACALLTILQRAVHPMFRVFIEPDLQTAHLRITNAFNPFAGFAAPTYVLKTDAAAAGLTPAAAAAALGAGCVAEGTEDTVDIYLLPPHADAATCATWLRMRAREGRYTIVFEEFVTDGPFIISPNVRYEVNVRVLGGLMALGYTVGAILKRSSLVLTDEQGMVTVKFDTIGDLSPTPFVQVQGKLRAAVEEVARRMGIEERSCIPASYIQQVQTMRANAAAGGADAGTSASMPRAASAADALHLFGVESFAEAAAADVAEADWAAASPPAEAPATPGGASPAERRDAGGARLAALSARVDALVDAMAAMQASQQHGAWGASMQQSSPMHHWASATPPPLSAYYHHAALPGTPGGETAALAAAQRALAARLEALRAPAVAVAAPWERLALAATVGALLGAAALRLSS